MHGIICKAVESFVTTRHGQGEWRAVLDAADLPFESLDIMRRYEAKTADALLRVCSQRLGVAPAHLLEDIGTWICTHPPLEPIRRLFRFSGDTFEELLYSLEELHEYVNMAMPGLDLPVLRLGELGGGAFRVTSTWGNSGAGALMLGVLRAMADDYGALALVEPISVAQSNGAWVEAISVQLLEERFADGRAFRLGGAA